MVFVITASNIYQLSTVLHSQHTFLIFIIIHPATPAWIHHLVKSYCQLLSVNIYEVTILCGLIFKDLTAHFFLHGYL